MTDNKAKPISISSREGISEKRTTPTGDAIRQFRRNKVAVVGLFIIVAIFILAITANFWTNLGVLDHAKGYRSQHTMNPVGWRSVDSFADPGQCARDNLEQGEAWCALVDAETRARFPVYCKAELPDLSQRQWCFVLGGDKQGKDMMTQTVYGARVSMLVALVGSLTRG